METKITLQDLLTINGIDPKDVLLIRHSLNHENFRKCFDNNFVYEYTQIQPGNLKALSEHKYWMVFISGKGTQARLFKFYEYKGKMPITEHIPSENYPGEWKADDVFYQLEETDLFRDLENRLIIDWGKGVINWYYKGTNQKPILAIQNADPKEFIGFDKLVLEHSQLESIVNDVTGEYLNYRVALSSVKGVYLILDKPSGDLYIGSAYGDDGILGRWKEYANPPYHGGNKRLIKLLNEQNDRYKNFQFCILQIFSKSATKEEVIEVENRFKEKLGSRVFGLNAN
ncbi:MAG: GIY-YIG nuclease family protein [Ruminiclostridium sp.]|nr:GIY-YIG nuclease family protein [Ruminiclostridium sp.]